MGISVSIINLIRGILAVFMNLTSIIQGTYKNIDERNYREASN